MQTRSDEVILDIATGTAFIPSYLKRHHKPYRRIIGLDLTFQMLQNANRNLDGQPSADWLSLVCASAHALPLKAGGVDRAICCLATHHMDANLLLSNIYRSLKAGGEANIADAGSSTRWKNGFVRFLIKSIAFLYFLFSENFQRAVAESSAIANIHTTREWSEMIKAAGFKNIDIRELKSKKFWAPNPVIISFQK
jgi:ubiquinone/menaquinone biosynthesis C-methylase UbiE